MIFMIEQYFVVDRKYGPFEYKEKGSRFISYLFPAISVEDADNILSALRKEFYDATHVCFAYRLGRGREDYFRSVDDGEPAGTAGPPIYQEIVRKELFNVFVAVIRYYGGVKLGKGGLIRAYSFSARQVIEEAEITTVKVEKETTVFIPFNFIGDMMYIINFLGVNIVSQDYTAHGVSMNLSVPIGKVSKFQDILIEKSCGKIQAEF